MVHTVGRLMRSGTRRGSHDQVLRSPPRLVLRQTAPHVPLHHKPITHSGVSRDSPVAAIDCKDLPPQPLSPHPVIAPCNYCICIPREIIPKQE